MIRRSRALTVSMLFAVAALAVLLAFPQVALAGHVAVETDTDTCAMCHRGHTASSNAWYRDHDSFETTRSALVIAPAGSDTGLCYSCHGATSEGSNTDIETAFSATSAHGLAPANSAFGPSPKQCSDCHDSHGSAKTADGDPFPALLRSRSASAGPEHSGEEYCAVCHRVARTGSRFDTLAIFRQTAHYSALPTPTSGTGIRCSVCHEPHGSANTALITARLTTESAGASYTVEANDRRFCAGCHTNPLGAFAGAVATYTASAHGESTKTVLVGAEYASAETTRAVGECQVCHAPMGRDDGTGKPVPAMAVKAQAQLCYDCHRPAGPAKADLASLATSPAAAPSVDLLAAYSPPALTGAYGRVAAYVQDPKATVPRTLLNPRSFDVTGTVGRMAVGDINGDSLDEVVLTDPAAARVSVLGQDALRGLAVPASDGVLSIAAPANAVSIANIFPAYDTNRPVVAVTTGSTAGLLYLYRLGDGGTFDQLGDSISIGDGPYAIATGDVTGTVGPDFVVTSKGSSEVRYVTASSTPGSATVGPAIATRPGPVAVATGDIAAGGKHEVAIVNDGEATGKLSVLNDDGAVTGTWDTTGFPGAVPSAVLVGEVLHGSAGAEVAVALASVSDTGGVEVFSQSDGTGLDTRKTYALGDSYAPGALALGDVDGDTRGELVAGNAGRRGAGSESEPPSVQVLQPNADGTDLTGSSTLRLGGVELAGRAPDIAVANLRKLSGPSRHPSGESASTHVATETAPFAMHVECTDCHEVHRADDSTATAPAAYGPLKGAWGVTPDNIAVGDIDMAQRQGVRYEYEVCLKCHSGWSGSLGSRRDVAFDFNAKNRSVHQVEATSATSVPADTFADAPAGRPAWTNASMLYCRDCHANSDTSQPKGPHTSANAPILASPYRGVAPSDASGLCYSCHRYDVYYTGNADGGTSASRFYSTSPSSPKLHATHMRTHGLGCDACHETHGSRTNPSLLRADIGFSTATGDGSCDNQCHGTPSARSYAR